MRTVSFLKKNKKTKTKLHAPDKSLLGALFILLTLGLVLLFSASSVVSYDKFGHTYFYFQSQLIAVVVSLFAFFIISKIDYKIWKKYATLFLLGSIVLLTLVFIPGIKADYGTSQSWINIFGFSLQPSEFVKLSFLIYLAAWLDAKRGQLDSWLGGIVPFIIVLTIISGLMLAQPDLGTLVIIIFSAAMAFFVGGGKMKHIFTVIVVGILAVIMVYNMGNFKNYQSERLACYKDPSASTLHHCYQLNQSLIAVGSGGLLGRGLGQSKQKFMYLPQVWGDSIFPIAAEELGFIFSTLLILLYLFIFYRGLLIARDAPDVFGTTLAVGVVSWLAVQTFLNIGGMTNLIPITGVPLPLISHGGTAMLSSMMSLGILINISKQTESK